MRWNKNAENRNVNRCDNSSRAIFQPPNLFLVLCNNRNSVYDNLHQQLDFKYPEEKNEEQKGQASYELVISFTMVRRLSLTMACFRRRHQSTGSQR